MLSTNESVLGAMEYIMRSKDIFQEMEFYRLLKYLDTEKYIQRQKTMYENIRKILWLKKRGKHV